MIKLYTSDRVDFRNVDKDTVHDAMMRKEDMSRRIPLNGARFTPEGTVIQGDDTLFLTKNGFSKVCTTLGIPARFAQAYHDIDPERTADTLNTLARHRFSDNLIMAVDGPRVEGLVTQSYTWVPNYDVVKQLFRTAAHATIRHLSIDGLKMRIAVTFGDEMPIAGSDILHPGADLFNSEDGGMSFKAHGYIFRLICSNGMMMVVVSRESRAIHRGNVLRYGRVSNMINEARNTALDSHNSILEAFATPLKKDRWERIVKQATPLLGKETEDELKQATITEHSERINNRLGGPDEYSVYDVWNAVTSRAKREPLVKARELEQFAFSAVLN